MVEGNVLYDFFFDGEVRNFDIEDVVEYCGNDLYIIYYD